MACSECGRELTGRPNAICPNVVHWRAWSEEVEGVLREVANFALDPCEQEACWRFASHRNTTAAVFYELCQGTNGVPGWRCHEHAEAGYERNGLYADMVERVQRTLSPS